MKKPELTDNEIVEIRGALRAEPEWMQRAFEIALHTGCRLRETRIPRNCVDLEENKITFPWPKGGEQRAFSVPMPSAVRPLMEEFRRRKEKFTVSAKRSPGEGEAERRELPDRTQWVSWNPTGKDWPSPEASFASLPAMPAICRNGSADIPVRNCGCCKGLRPARLRQEVDAVELPGVGG